MDYQQQYRRSGDRALGFPSEGVAWLECQGETECGGVDRLHTVIHVGMHGRSVVLAAMCLTCGDGRELYEREAGRVFPASAPVAPAPAAAEPTRFRCESARDERGWRAREAELAATDTDAAREELRYLRAHAQHPRGVGYAMFVRRHGRPLPIETEVV